MNNTLKLILSALIFSLCHLAAAQNFKIIERSAKSQPTWITDIVQGYVVGLASGTEINDAQNDALLDVKQRIAQSIASNITVDIMQSSITTTTNNSVEYEAKASDLVRSTTDKIPYLQSISLSEVSEFYWEKLSDKKNNIVKYKYYIKYPFSSSELQRLVREFKEEQNFINNTIKQMSDELNTFDRVETIEKNMSTLRALRPKLADNDARITQIDELVNTYRGLYKNISIVEFEHNNKQVVLKLLLDGREVTTAQIPKHKSNCADRITKQIENGNLIVTYDDYVCLQGEDNWLELTYKFGVNYVSKRIYI
ncbi:MAG: hypothetical protein R3Y59_04315 [bacterium]